MKSVRIASVITFLFTVVLCSCNTLQMHSGLPEIPNYVGKSYNLAKGNPMAKSIDTGFLADVFQITYNEGRTTEDGKYIVPDGVTRSQVSACAFTSEEKIYRGTQSYRE